MNEKDHIATWLLGLLLIGTLVAITLYGHVLVNAAYKASDIIVGENR